MLPMQSFASQTLGEVPVEKSAGATPSPFRDRLASGGHGPDMVRIPAGKFRMGCIPPADEYRCESGRPVHDVTIPADFAMAVHETTFDEFDRFLEATGRAMRNDEADDHGFGRGRRPIINIRYRTAEAYAAWLTRETGHAYRLPSEAEWEYAARAGAETVWNWGNDLGRNRANCRDCGSPWDNESTAPVGSFPPNRWGLHDMHGNVWEMVQDCEHDGYRGAPTDGTAWLKPSRFLGMPNVEDENKERCAERIIRGGSWIFIGLGAQSAARVTMDYRSYDSITGFRVVREVESARL